MSGTCYFPTQRHISGLVCDVANAIHTTKVFLQCNSHLYVQVLLHFSSINKIDKNEAQMKKWSFDGDKNTALGIA